jgi:hypothetical protein
MSAEPPLTPTGMAAQWRLDNLHRNDWTDTDVGLYVEHSLADAQQEIARPFDALPDAHAEHVTKWLKSNEKEPQDVRWSLYPLGMVGRWIERTEKAEAELRAAREREQRLREDVRAFAEKMSAAMDSKAIERETRNEPHYAKAEYRVEDALPRMREKVDELLYAFGLSTGDDFRTFSQNNNPDSVRAVKTAVHLANFCMILATKAESALKETEG